MDRSYKIYKSYHTSHHNTTKTHLQISTPPSSVQQRTDAHNLPDKHVESQASKLQASSNAPTLTTSLQTTWNLNLPNYRRPATRRRSQPPVKPQTISAFPPSHPAQCEICSRSPGAVVSPGHTKRLRCLTERPAHNSPCTLMRTWLRQMGLTLRLVAAGYLSVNHLRR